MAPTTRLITHLGASARSGRAPLNTEITLTHLAGVAVEVEIADVALNADAALDITHEASLAVVINRAALRLYALPAVLITKQTFPARYGGTWCNAGVIHTDEPAVAVRRDVTAQILNAALLFADLVGTTVLISITFRLICTAARVAPPIIGARRPVVTLWGLYAMPVRSAEITVQTTTISATSSQALLAFTDLAFSTIGVALTAVYAAPVDAEPTRVAILVPKTHRWLDATARD